MAESTVSLSLSLEQVARIKQEVLRGRPYSTRVSFPLVVRLADIYVNQGDYWPVLDELDFLEGIRETSAVVAGTQFRHQPLYPFWHKHFSSARHIPRNIALRWKGKDGSRDLDRLIDAVADAYGEDPTGWQSVLSHRVIHDGYLGRIRCAGQSSIREYGEGARRGGGLTGDWIIYGKHEGANYYLDLATHEEGSKERAASLYDKLRKGCFAEFSFLFS